MMQINMHYRRMHIPEVSDDILKQLAANDGACLYWQMRDPHAVLAAVKAGELRMVGDLVIHPDATEIEAGMAYTLRPLVTPRDMRGAAARSVALWAFRKMRSYIKQGVRK
jgi:hypothetical protein